MGGKRSNEYNQMKKEDYEALEDIDSGSHSSGGFERADGVGLQNRRVVRARRPIAPPPAENSSATSVNPFASVNLLSNASAAPAFVAVPITFGSSGASAQSIKFSFGAASAASVAVALKPAEKFYPASVQLVQSYQSEITKLSKPEEFQCSNWSNVVEHYAKYSDFIHEKWKQCSSGAATTAAPAPSVPATNYGSFAKAKTPAPRQTFAPAAPSPVQGDDADGEADIIHEDDENDKIQPAVDPDWDDIQEFGPVRFYRFNDPKDPNSGWVLFCRGQLRLQKHKTDASKSRIVLRDKSGIKVHVNMLVTTGMKFQLTEKTTKKGVREGLIIFNGVNDTDRGFEGFTVRSNFQTSKDLHAALEKLVA
jgi:hypothetical protein